MLEEDEQREGIQIYQVITHLPTIRNSFFLIE
jgi:hypothetical protein